MSGVITAGRAVAAAAVAAEPVVTAAVAAGAGAATATGPGPVAGAVLACSGGAPPHALATAATTRQVPGKVRRDTALGIDAAARGPPPSDR